MVEGLDVIRFCDHFDHPPNLVCIVMELYSQGTLEDKAEKVSSLTWLFESNFILRLLCFFVILFFPFQSGPGRIPVLKIGKYATQILLGLRCI